PRGRGNPQSTVERRHAAHRFGRRTPAGEPPRARVRRAARETRAGQGADRPGRARRRGGMTNLAAARAVIERVRAAGVTDFCVCGGSRNAPLIAVVSGNVYTFVDERSPAFFAVGRIKPADRPVAAIPTSAT